MAVKSALGDDGWTLWDAWSAQSEEYEARVAQTKWRSFSIVGGIRIGTLFHIAKQYGWKPTKGRKAQDVINTMVALQPSDDEREQAKRRVSIAELRVSKQAQLLLHDAEHAEESHPYLARKGFAEWRPQLVLPSVTLTFSTKRNDIVMRTFDKTFENQLIIPMRNYYTKDLQSAQLIATDGTKLFLPDGKGYEAVHRIGLPQAQELWYVEGYATGLSVKAALESMYVRAAQIVVCFSAGTMSTIANGDNDMRKKKYVIADHDKDKKGRNKGLEVAQKIQEQRGIPYWISEQLGDANDYHMRYGLSALREQLRQLRKENR